MSRYFHYRSIDDLEAENRRLGLDLRFSSDLTPLFRPVTIGSLRVGNSLCIHPMEGCDGTLDGRPDVLTFRRFERFGSGGAKLVWGEATAVVLEGRATPRQLLLDDRTAPDFERLAHRCREAHREACGSSADFVLGLQLTHSGRYSCQRPLPVCRNSVPSHGTRVGRNDANDYPLLSDDELHRLPDAYVATARLAQRAGFQFVDIKQCHGYLLNELLAAKTRHGPYGGSLENRTRLAREIIDRIRSEVPGLEIATRLGVFDGIPFRPGPFGGPGEPCAWQPPVHDTWGTREDDPTRADLEEPIWWIGEMARLGVSLVGISMGSPYTNPHLTRPFEVAPPDGYEAPEHPLVSVDRHFRLAEQLQAAYPQLPMVGSGYSYLQEFLFQAGAANLRDRRIALLGVGRAALAQPDFARQLQDHGKLDRKRVCRTFSYCTALMRAKNNDLGQFATGCPPFDKEVYGPLWRQLREK